MEQKKIIKIEPIVVGEFTVNIKGKAPLIMDKFTDAAKDLIIAKQTGVSKGNKKKIRDIKDEIKHAIHITSKGKIGFPAYGFKRGMAECTSFVGDKFFSKKLVYGAVRIVNTEDGLVPITYKKQDVLEHNIGHNVKYSPQFHDWGCKLTIRYDKNNISAQDIITLLNYAGFYVGIGGNRPKGGGGGTGEFGTYEVSNK